MFGVESNVFGVPGCPFGDEAGGADCGADCDDAGGCAAGGFVGTGPGIEGATSAGLVPVDCGARVGVPCCCTDCCPGGQFTPGAGETGIEYVAVDGPGEYGGVDG